MMKPIDAGNECDWAAEALFEQRDGSLDGASARRLNDHLERCADCRRELAWDAAFVERFRAGPVAAARLISRVESQLRRRRLLGFAGLTGVAAGILLLVTVTLVNLRAAPTSVSVASNRDEDITNDLVTALTPPKLEFVNMHRELAALEQFVEKRQ